MAKESALEIQEMKVAVRGITLLLSRGIDLLPIARKAENNERLSPVEAVVLSGYWMVRGQLAELLREQGLEDMPEEYQEVHLRSVLRQAVEEFVMLNSDGCQV